jgi:hypothetical protein
MTRCIESEENGYWFDHRGEGERRRDMEQKSYRESYLYRDKSKRGGDCSGCLGIRQMEGKKNKDDRGRAMQKG